MNQASDDSKKKKGGGEAGKGSKAEIKWTVSALFYFAQDSSLYGLMSPQKKRVESWFLIDTTNVLICQIKLGQLTCLL